jgi:hypothetical protein
MCWTKPDGQWYSAAVWALWLDSDAKDPIVDAVRGMEAPPLRIGRISDARTRH